jgi:hypothetical protein
MKFFLPLFFILCFHSIAGARVIPIQDRVDSALLTKDFVSFKNFSDNLSKSEKGIQCYWEFLRELVSGYNEGIFYFEKDGFSSVSTFRITMLTTDSTIISFELSEQLYRKIKDDESEPYFEIKDQYKNDSLFALLQSSFKAVFGTELKESELFNESVVYGGHCGYGGIERPEMQELDKMVMKKDRKGLDEWLQSANVEKQVYAVDGLSQLKRKGELITPEEMRMIHAIKNKKGEIRTCSGCIYGNKKISEVVSDFRF